MFQTPPEDKSLFLSRTDVNEPLSSFSRHGFELDDFHWPSVEHYFQAMKFEDSVYREVVRRAPHPKNARRLGRSRIKRIRKDWSKIRRVIMTRAVYTKSRTHPQVAERLLETDGLILVESSQFDYFWGCGRDKRGSNVYGAVLMDVRARLLDELDSEPGSPQ